MAVEGSTVWSPVMGADSERSGNKMMTKRKTKRICPLSHQAVDFTFACVRMVMVMVMAVAASSSDCCEGSSGVKALRPTDHRRQKTMDKGERGETCSKAKRMRGENGREENRALRVQSC